MVKKKKNILNDCFTGKLVVESKVSRNLHAETEEMKKKKMPEGTKKYAKYKISRKAFLFYTCWQHSVGSHNNSPDIQS